MKKITNKILLLLIFTFSVQLSYADDAHLYVQRLAKMRSHGIINAVEQKKQLAQLKAQEDSHKKFQSQTRGVASKLNKIKIYEIKNDPIEIPSN